MIKLIAFRYAWKGLLFFIGRERHAALHLFISMLTLVLGLILNLKTWEWIIIFLCLAMVISMEIINSSIERLTDIISPQRSATAGAVKDLGAAAVLVSSFFAAIVGLIIFVPKFYDFLNF